MGTSQSLDWYLSSGGQDLSEPLSPSNTNRSVPVQTQLPQNQTVSSSPPYSRQRNHENEYYDTFDNIDSYRLNHMLSSR